MAAPSGEVVQGRNAPLMGAPTMSFGVVLEGPVAPREEPEPGDKSGGPGGPDMRSGLDPRLEVARDESVVSFEGRRTLFDGLFQVPAGTGWRNASGGAPSRPGTGPSSIAHIFEEIFGSVEAQAAGTPSTIRMFLEDGYNVCVPVFLGQPEDQSTNGLATWILSTIVKEHGERTNRRNAASTSTSPAGDGGTGATASPALDFDVSASFVMIRNEAMVDLFTDVPGSTGSGQGALSVETSLTEGTVVRGASRVSFHDRSSISSAVERARAKLHPLSVPFVTVLDITYSRSATVANGETRILNSRMVVPELHGCNCWAENEGNLTVRHGGRRYRSIFGFREMCTAVRKQDLPDTNRAILSRLLQDFVGGDAIVVCVAMLDGLVASPMGLSAVLDVCRTLGKSVHYPLSRRYTFAEGLMRRVWAREAALRAASTVAGAAREETKVRGEVAREQRRCQQLEEELAGARVEVAEARDDSVKMLKLLELFKEKYQTLVQAKAEQAEQLIAAEELKAKVTNSMLEMKLGLNRERQSFEEKRYALETEILRLRNETTEAHEQTGGNKLRMGELEQRLAEVSAERDKLRKAEDERRQEAEAHAETAAQLISAARQVEELQREVASMPAGARSTTPPPQQPPPPTIDPGVVHKQVHSMLRPMTSEFEARMRDVSDEASEAVDALETFHNRLLSKFSELVHQSAAPSQRNSDPEAAEASLQQAEERALEMEAKYINTISRLSTLQARLKEQAEEPSWAARLEGINAELVSQLEQLSKQRATAEETKESQIVELKRQVRNLKAKESVRSVLKGNWNLLHQKQNKQLKEEVDQASSENRKLIEEIEKLKNMPPTTAAGLSQQRPESVEGNSVSHEAFVDSERRCAQLLTQNTMLEEELRSYKDYMKLTVARYKSQIEDLRTGTAHAASAPDASSAAQYNRATPELPSTYPTLASPRARLGVAAGTPVLSARRGRPISRQ